VRDGAALKQVYVQSASRPRNCHASSEMQPSAVVSTVVSSVGLPRTSPKIEHALNPSNMARASVSWRSLATRLSRFPFQLPSSISRLLVAPTPMLALGEGIPVRKISIPSSSLCLFLLLRLAGTRLTRLRCQLLRRVLFTWAPRLGSIAWQGVGMALIGGNFIVSARPVRIFTASPNPPPSRGPIDTEHVTEVCVASFLCCFAAY